MTDMHLEKVNALLPLEAAGLEGEKVAEGRMRGRRRRATCPRPKLRFGARLTLSPTGERGQER